MRISHFFIDRPIFAAVVSIVFVILGGVSLLRGCRSRNIRKSRRRSSTSPASIPAPAPRSSPPPSSRRSRTRSTASRGMLYVSSNSTADGRFSIAVTFDLGTNLDIAQVQVQNRVAIAQPRLPADVRNIGVTVTKSSPDLMMVVHLYSPDKSRDDAVRLQLRHAGDQGRAHPRRRRRLDHRVRQPRLRDAHLARPRPAAVARHDRAGCDHRVAGPERPGRLRRAQPAAGRSAAARSRSPCRRSGRLTDPEEFGDIAVKTTPNAVVRLRMSPGSSSPRRTTARTPISTAIRRWRSPCSSGPAPTRWPPRDAIRATMERAVAAFPAGRQVRHRLRSDPVHPAIGQRGGEDDRRGDRSWSCWSSSCSCRPGARRSFPIVAIPVSLIGTFFFMSLFGFTLNNLSLFGLVLAVGIVVDDAIVVVENVERNIAAGHDAARRRDHAAWTRSARALVAIALVLCGGVRPVRLHHRHFGAVLSAVRAHHRGRDRHLADRLADAVAGAVRAAAASRMTDAASATAAGAADARRSSAVQLRASTGFAAGYGWLVGARGALRRDHAGRLCRRAGVRLQRIPQDAGRLHPAARPRLSHRRGAVAAGRVARAHRRGAEPRGRHRARKCRACAARSTSSASPARPSRKRRMPARFSWCSSRSTSAPATRRRSATRIQAELFQQLRADPGGAASLWCCRRRCAASAMPAVSA